MQAHYLLEGGPVTAAAQVARPPGIATSTGAAKSPEVNSAALASLPAEPLSVVIASHHPCEGPPRVREFRQPAFGRLAHKTLHWIESQ